MSTMAQIGHKGILNNNDFIIGNLTDDNEDLYQVPPPPMMGSYLPPPPPYQRNYGATTIVIQPSKVITVNDSVAMCPICRVGIVLTDRYSWLAILIAIIFFPFGLLCCLAMRQKRCTNCSSTF